MKKIFLSIGMIVSMLLGYSQGLEAVIVETYYISDANDATDTDGGTLTAGSVTYRVYVDMAPNFEFQAAYGDANHEMFIETTTQFFNNEDRGENTGEAIGTSRVSDGTVALDSWLSAGGATDNHWGIMKAEDSDGSIVGGMNNDGGSTSVSGGLLVNNEAVAGIPLTIQDGLVAGTPEITTIVGFDPSTLFGSVNGGTRFSTNNGAWSSLAGVQGPTATNRVLIGQFTTNGEFSFELNVQLGTPTGGVENYVANNPVGSEIVFADLTFVSGPNSVEENLTNQANVKLFPNPVQNILFVDLDNVNGLAENFTYTITDISGKVVDERALTISNNGAADASINIADLTRGFYTLNLTSSKGEGFHQKFIKR